MALLDTLKGDVQRVTILSGDIVKVPTGGIASTGSILEVDVSLEEQHTLAAELTDHPVERGFDVTDHRRPGPAQLSMRGLVSDTPSGTIAAIGEAFDPGSASRSQDAYTILKEFHEKNAICAVITALRLYENMLLTRLSVQRDSATGKVLAFDTEWREIRIAESRTVRVQAVDTPTKPSPEKKAHEGKKPMVGPPAPTGSLLGEGFKGRGILKSLETVKNFAKKALPIP